MFKKFVAIAFAALVAASVVTGCGNNAGNTQADSRTETDSQPNKAGKKDSKIKIENYARRVYMDDDTNRTGKYRVSIDLEGYLNAYGATEIMPVVYDTYLGEAPAYAVKFKNGTVLGLAFENVSDGDKCYQLSKIMIAGCTPEFKCSYYDTLVFPFEARNDYLSHWNRELYMSWDENTKDDFFGKPESILIDRRMDAIFYPSFPDASELRLPISFYKTFKSTVVPYLELDNVPLDKDPFKEDKNMLGESHEWEW